MAQALGQRDIDAKVMVWQVVGPLLWEGATSGQTRAGPEAGLPRLFKRARDNSARLRDCLLVSVQDGFNFFE